jgi:hypothetical protein
MPYASPDYSSIKEIDSNKVCRERDEELAPRLSNPS